MATRAVVVLRLPTEMKQRLDALRREGRTINGYITHLIEREFARTQQPAATRSQSSQKGR